MSKWCDEEAPLDKDQDSPSGPKAERQESLLTFSPVNGANQDNQATRTRLWFRRGIVLLVVIALKFFIYIWASQGLDSSDSRSALGLGHSYAGDETLCPQEPPLSPGRHAGLVMDSNELYSSKLFEDKAIQLLAGAVQIRKLPQLFRA